MGRQNVKAEEVHSLSNCLKRVTEAFKFALKQSPEMIFFLRIVGKNLLVRIINITQTVGSCALSRPFKMWKACLPSDLWEQMVKLNKLLFFPPDYQSGAHCYSTKAAEATTFDHAYYGLCVALIPKEAGHSCLWSGKKLFQAFMEWILKGEIKSWSIPKSGTALHGFVKVWKSSYFLAFAPRKSPMFSGQCRKLKGQGTRKCFPATTWGIHPLKESHWADKLNKTVDNSFL